MGKIITLFARVITLGFFLPNNNAIEIILRYRLFLNLIFFVRYLPTYYYVLGFITL